MRTPRRGFGGWVAAALVLVFAGWALLRDAPDEPDTPAPGGGNESAAKPPLAPVLAGVGGETPGTVAVRAGEGHARVAVVVLDPDRTPLADARVVLRDGEGKAVLGEGKTDAEGTLRFAGVPRGNVRAAAWHEGFVPEWAEGWVDANEPATLEVSLRPGVPLAGRVVADEDGSAIAGARVQAIEGEHARVPALSRIEGDVDETTTDAEGRFRFPGLPSEGALTVVATAPGRAVAGRVLSRVAEGTTVEVRLPTGGRVEGTVLAPDGTACADAEVFLVSPEDEDAEEDPRVAREDLRTRTAPDGSFAFAGVAFGAKVRVLAEGCGGSRGASAPDAVVKSAPVARLDVRLVARGGLRIRVERADGRERRDPARVWLLGARRHFLDPTSDDGWRETVEPGAAALFEGLLPGAYDVEAAVESSREARERVTVAAGRTTEVVLRGRAGIALEGTVVDAKGRPVFYANVVARVVGTEATEARTESTRTDDAGRFRVENLEDVDTILEVFHAPFVQHRQEHARPGTPVRVVLQRAAVVRGRLDLPEGVPLPPRMSIKEYYSRGPIHDRMTSVGADGSFEIVAYETGKAFVRLEVPGAGPTYVGPLSLPYDAEVDLGAVRVDAGRTIAGRVVDDRGVPVVGARVSASVQLIQDAPWGVDDRSLVTDAEGRFTTERTSNDRAVVLVVVAPSRVNSRHRVEPGATATEVVLVSLGRFGGRVIGPDGKPVLHAQLILCKPGQRPGEGETHWVPVAVDGDPAPTVEASAGEWVVWLGTTLDASREIGHVTLVAGETVMRDWTLP